MSVLAVLSTHVPRGQVERGVPIRSCSPPYDYHHDFENKLDTIKFTLACHEHYKAGMKYKLIIVDNGSEDDEWAEFQKTLPYEIYHRENVGFSFGSHKWAWEKFGKEYDYYLFMEQDASPAKKHWLKEIHRKFVDSGAGMLGNYIEQHPTDAGYVQGMEEWFPGIKNKDTIYNLDGFWSFTSAEVLSKVELIVAPVTPGGKIQDIWNELGFQQPILDAGYELAEFAKTHRFYRGVSLKNLPVEQYKLPITPLVLAHTRKYAEKRHFRWYEGK